MIQNFFDNQWELKGLLHDTDFQPQTQPNFPRMGSNNRNRNRDQAADRGCGWKTLLCLGPLEEHNLALPWYYYYYYYIIIKLNLNYIILNIKNTPASRGTRRIFCRWGGS